jgi:hypothetical protein
LTRLSGPWFPSMQDNLQLRCAAAAQPPRLHLVAAKTISDRLSFPFFPPRPFGLSGFQTAWACLVVICMLVVMMTCGQHELQQRHTLLTACRRFWSAMHLRPSADCMMLTLGSLSAKQRYGQPPSCPGMPTSGNSSNSSSNWRTRRC